MTLLRVRSSTDSMLSTTLGQILSVTGERQDHICHDTEKSLSAAQICLSYNLVISVRILQTCLLS